MPETILDTLPDTLPDTGQDAVLIITTGGTIDKVYFDAKSDYEVGETVIGELLQQAHVHCEYTIRPLMRKDSLELNADDRAQIRAAIEGASEDKIVITHGTDTMTDTAEALEGIDKTIVLTGSLAPARFAQSDATFNVGMAFASVQRLVPGIYIVMNGQVFDGHKVKKDRSQNRFLRLS